MKKNLVKAITLGLLLALPTAVSAQDYTETLFLGSNAGVSRDLDDSININVQGNTHGAYHLDGVKIYEGSSLTLGNQDSEINVAVKGNGNTIGLLAAGEPGYDGPQVTISGKLLKVDVESTSISMDDYVYGIHSANRTTPDKLDRKQQARVVINTENTIINVKAGNNDGVGLVTMSQGIMEINGNLEVTADRAIVARGDSIVKINASNDKIVKLNGDIDFNYDEKTSRTGVDADVLVNLSGAESYWNGSATVSYGTGKITPEEKAEVTGLKLGISDGAQWNPNFVEEYENDGSGVKAIALNQVEMNGGIINLENAADQKIRIETLSGAGGTINLANEKNALAITKANQAKSLTVAATSDYAEALASNDMASSAQKVANQVIDETADTSTQTAATDVYIPETAVTGAYTAKVEDGLVVSGQEAVNSTNKAVSEMANHNLMVWRLENNDMNKRLGELRDSKGEHGVWVRMTRGEGKYKAIKNQYNAYQLGYDEKLSTDKSWTVGAAFTYTDGETSFATGSGENKHKGFAVYGSKLNKDGSFIDLIAKYSRLDNEFKAVAGIGNGEYETNGYSVSAEYGKRFTKANGFWIEPQVELTYGKVGSASYVTSKGVLAQQEGMESLVGRIGFAAGKNFKRGNAYMRASYLYDFDGDTKVTYSNASAARSIEDDLGGGWFEVGIGSNINLSKATHLYVDIEKTYGGDVAVPWQWNAGLRYSF